MSSARWFVKPSGPIESLDGVLGDIRVEHGRPFVCQRGDDEATPALRTHGRVEHDGKASVRLHRMAGGHDRRNTPNQVLARV
jgi:hypothetical protein